MSAWYLRPAAPTASAEVGRARAARSASVRCVTTADGWYDRSGSAGRRLAYADCLARDAARDKNGAARRSATTPETQTPRGGARNIRVPPDPTADRGRTADRWCDALPPGRRATIAPERHPRQAIVGCADMHAAGDEIGLAVAVEIPYRQRHQVRRRAGDVVHRELLVPIVLQPDEALRGRIVPVVVGADHDDINVAVAVDVGRLRARGAGEIRDPMQ